MPVPDREGDVRAALARLLIGPDDARLDPALDAGLPEGARFLPLTLKRTYALAMLRDLRPEALKKSREVLIDPETLDALAKEAGVDDFGRFRDWFFERKPGVPGDDPTAAGDIGARFLDVLSQGWEVRARSRLTAALERSAKFFSLLAQGGAASGISQLQADQLELNYRMSRANLDSLILRYQNSLDRLKVDIGLPPDAPVVPQDDLLSDFDKVFDAADRAVFEPGGDASRITSACDRLPSLPDIQVGGVSVMGVSSGSARLADLMSSIRKGLDDRGRLAVEEGDRAHLQARELARALAEIPAEYASSRRAFELSKRQHGRTLELLVSPPEAGVGGPAGGSTRLTVQSLNLITSLNSSQAQAGSIVRTWTRYQTRRIALYHALGEMPFEDWQDFVQSFKAKAVPLGEGAPEAP